MVPSALSSTIAPVLQSLVTYLPSTGDPQPTHLLPPPALLRQIVIQPQPTLTTLEIPWLLERNSQMA